MGIRATQQESDRLDPTEQTCDERRTQRGGRRNDGGGCGPQNVPRFLAQSTDEMLAVVKTESGGSIGSVASVSSVIGRLGEEIQARRRRNSRRRRSKTRHRRRQGGGRTTNQGGTVRGARPDTSKTGCRRVSHSANHDGRCRPVGDSSPFRPRTEPRRTCRPTAETERPPTYRDGGRFADEKGPEVVPDPNGLLLLDIRFRREILLRPDRVFNAEIRSFSVTGEVVHRTRTGSFSLRHISDDALVP